MERDWFLRLIERPDGRERKVMTSVLAVLAFVGLPLLFIGTLSWLLGEPVFEHEVGWFILGGLVLFMLLGALVEAVRDAVRSWRRGR